MVAIREDIREALNRAWPDGVIEMTFDSEDSYFGDVYPTLAAALRRIKGSHLAHEIEAEAEPVWFDDSDSGEDLPDDREPSRSYHIFFVCPDGEEFTYETEIESLAEPGGLDEGEDEAEWPMEAVSGTGTTGWCVAVSLLAPFAVITLSDREVFEDGSASEPSIESRGFTEAGQRIDPEAEFLKFKGEQAFEKLLKLRGRIVDILDRYGIGVLPEEECRKPVSWLRADPGVLVGIAGDPIRALDALFFEGL